MNQLLFLLGCFFCFGLLLFVLMGGFIIKLVRKQTKPKTEEEKTATKRQMSKEVQAQVADLSTWEDDSYAVIAYQRSVGFLGKSKHICDVEGNPLVVFQYWRQSTSITKYYGYIVAAMSNTRVFIECETGGNFTVAVDGRLLGYVKNFGAVILNKEKEIIGQAKHPEQLSVSMNNLTTAKQMKYPVQLHGKHLADINIKLEPVNNDEEDFFSRAQEVPIIPVLSSCNTPNKEEQEWLTILALLEVIFY